MSSAIDGPLSVAAHCTRALQQNFVQIQAKLRIFVFQVAEEILIDAEQMRLYVLA